jgi:hypothetical protein
MIELLQSIINGNQQKQKQNLFLSIRLFQYLIPLIQDGLESSISLSISKLNSKEFLIAKYFIFYFIFSKLLHNKIFQ